MMKLARMVVMLSCVTGALGFAQDWPRFLGPNGSGVSGSTGVPTVFGPGKNLVWKTDVPFARSSPVVSGDRVFLTASEGENLIVLALDRASGKTTWRRDIPRLRSTPIYKMNDAASPTPVTDGKNVYVFFADLGLLSLDADGNERWRLPLGPFDTFYGLAASPILAGDTLLMLCDARSKPFLIAVDAATGRQRWRVERTEVYYEGYATPLIYEPPGGSAQVLVLGANRLDAYAVETGEKLWWVRGLGYYPVGSPALGRDMVVLSTYGADSASQAGPVFDELLKGDANKDGKLARDEFEKDSEMFGMFGAMDFDGDGYLTRAEYDKMQRGAVGDYGLAGVRLGGRGDVTATHVAWRDKKIYNNLPSLLIYQDVLYVSKQGGIIGALDPSTGTLLKLERPREATGDYYASPVAADGKVYFVGDSGKVVVLKAGKDWRIESLNDLDEECHASPAISGGRIFIRTRSALYCFGQ